jgi:hypothetical protein
VLQLVRNAQIVRKSATASENLDQSAVVVAVAVAAAAAVVVVVVEK